MFVYVAFSARTMRRLFFSHFGVAPPSNGRRTKHNSCTADLIIKKLTGLLHVLRQKHVFFPVISTFYFNYIVFI